MIRSLALCAMVVGAIVGVDAGTAPRAHAQVPQIELVLEGTWPSALAAGVHNDLQASMTERGLALVDGTAGSRVIARVRMSAPTGPASVVRVEIDDRLNRKRLEREIVLEGEPVDTWSVLLAAGADELLRAAWVELTMVDAPTPAMPPPASVLEAARSSVDSATLERSFVLRLAGAIDAYPSGTVLVGGDLVASFFVTDRLAIDVGLALRRLLPATSALGSVDALAIGGDLGVSLALLDRSGSLAINLLGALRALALDLTPVAVSAVRAVPALDAVVSLRTGVHIGVMLGRALELGLALFVGGVLRGAVAADSNGTRLAVLETLELGARLELGWWR